MGVSWRVGDVDEIECGEDDVGDETSATRKLFEIIRNEMEKEFVKLIKWHWICIGMQWQHFFFRICAKQANENAYH